MNRLLFLFLLSIFPVAATPKSSQTQKTKFTKYKSNSKLLQSKTHRTTLKKSLPIHQKTPALTSPSDCVNQPSAVQLTHYATHETYCLQPIHQTMQFTPEQMQAIKQLMRCHITQKQGDINPTLVELMYKIAQHFPSRTLTIIAGYRGSQLAKQKGNQDSPHTVGNAVDFFVNGASSKEVFDYIRSHYQQISAIYYPNREPKEPNFVHLNPRAAGKPNWFKIDHSKPGETSNYQDPPPLKNQISTSEKNESDDKMNEKWKKEKTPTMETETAILAAGCFWGVEEIIRNLPGVIETQVGYTGGNLADPTYPNVKTGKTGHAEAVRVFFHPKQISYETLLGYFFRLHDPTTPNQQGNDIGTQYRSAIFYQNEKQKQVAESVLQQVEKSGKWKKPIVTQIVPAQHFYLAEDYHQKYLVKNPGGYTCHFLRD